MNFRFVSILVQAGALRQECETLRQRIAELESELAHRLKLGSEAFDLAAAQRQRDRMENVRPHFPTSLAGVFSISQHQQEIFVLETLGFKREGFFLEIGVGPGKNYSNTYLLEKYFAWKGILCEPNPAYWPAIRENRSVTLDTRAVFSKSKEIVRFLCVPCEYGLLSTISDFKDSDSHNRWGEEVDIETVTLDDLLTQHNTPRDIDYISIDTEGSETKIIENFDFNNCISLLTIKHNLVPGRAEQVDSILFPFGYMRVYTDISGGDAWYQRKRG